MFFKNKVVLSLILLIVLPLSGKLYAQGPPIFSDTPILLGLEGRGIRTFGKYISQKNARVYTQILAVPFNLTPKLLVGGVVPFMRKSPEGEASQTGVGDLAVFVKQLLFQKDGRGKTFRTLVKLRQSFPTGRTDTQPAIGSGAYQTLLSLVSAYITTSYGIYGEFGYQFKTNDLPNNFMYNLAFVLPVLPQQYPPKQINLALEFNGNYTQEVNRHQLFISPGIQWIGGIRFLLETGIQLPLLEQVPDNQKTNFMYTLGTRILIF